MKDIEFNRSAEAARNLKRDYMKTPDAVVYNNASGGYSAFNSMKKYCQQNPATAVVFAFGVGSVAGVLFEPIFNQRPLPLKRKLIRFLLIGAQTWGLLKTLISPFINTNTRKMNGGLNEK